MNSKDSKHEERRYMDDEEKQVQQYAMQLVSASVLPMALKAAVELGIFEIIQRAGPGALLSPSQIASQLPTQTNPDAPLLLDRILRVLATHSILTFSLVTDPHVDGHDVRHFGLAPVAKYFIRTQDGGSLSPLLELYQDKAVLDIWYHMKDVVLEGGLAFNRAHGMTALEYMGKDVRFGEIFKDSMTYYNNIFVEDMLESYKGFQGLKTLIDVGGGSGFILHQIVSRYPEIKGINFDLPQIIDKSPYPGIEHVAGDMFKSIPKGDAIFMKWILHSLDDEQCLEVLKNCYQALPVNGKVIVVELVIPEIPHNSNTVRSVYQFEMLMTNINSGGKERTEREFESLGKRAGFSRVQVACCAYSFSIVEFCKNMSDLSAEA